MRPPTAVTALDPPSAGLPRPAASKTASTPHDKQAVAGVLQRATDTTTSKVKAFPVEKEIKPVMWGVIRDHVQLDSTIYTDEARTYHGVGR